MAVKDTVAAYNKPKRRALRRQNFSETHITRNIQAQQLATVKEEPEKPRTPSPAPPKSDNGKDVEKELDVGPRDSASTSSATIDVSAQPSIPSADLAQAYPDPEEITAETLDAHMYTKHDPPLDMLIRTSAVERLSDFMLWQAHEKTAIYFLECLWPEFDLWQFLPILVEWQWMRRKEAEKEALEGRGRPRSKQL
jgi:ditrans,polycis-polyprenyl diphosphate synthase